VCRVGILVGLNVIFFDGCNDGLESGRFVLNFKLGLIVIRFEGCLFGTAFG